MLSVTPPFAFIERATSLAWVAVAVECVATLVWSAVVLALLMVALPILAHLGTTIVLLSSYAISDIAFVGTTTTFAAAAAARWAYSPKDSEE